MKRAIVALAMLGAAPVTKPMQFDLLCTGTAETTDSVAGIQSEPYQDELRVDLTAKRFCEHGCSRAQDIAEIRPETIIFISRNPQRDPRLPSESYGVDRVKGTLWHAYSDLTSPSRYTASTNAQCQLAPFKGLPTPATKF